MPRATTRDKADEGEGDTSDTTRRPGPAPDRLKIDDDFESAVSKALRKGKPPKQQAGR